MPIDDYGVINRSPQRRLREILNRPKPKFWDGRKEVTKYIYTNKDGQYQFEKIRYELDFEIWKRKKDFRCFTRSQVNPNLLRPGAPERASVLYCLPDLLRSGHRSTVHWTEGEKDTEALQAAGLVATTTHTGALKCSVQQALWVVRARPRVVAIWVDRDYPEVTGDPRSDPEVGAYGAAIRQSALIKAGFKGRILFVEARGDQSKDAFDHLKAGFETNFGKNGIIVSDTNLIYSLAKSYAKKRAKARLNRSSLMGYTNG